MTSASEILDLAFAIGLYAPRVSDARENDGRKVIMLTFGRPAYRKTLILSRSLSKEAIEAKLQAEAGVMALSG